MGSARRRLLAWHSEIGSGHPWRHEGAEPWRVLVGELCLGRGRPTEQATILTRVVGVAPDPSTLASLGTDALPRLRTAGLSQATAEALVAVAAALEELYAGETRGGPRAAPPARGRRRGREASHFHPLYEGWPEDDLQFGLAA